MLTAPDAAVIDAADVDRDGAGLPVPMHERTLLVERGAWSLVWLGVLTGGVDLWGFWWWSPTVIVLALVMVAGGLLGIGSCWLVRSPRARVFQGVTLGAVIVAVLFPQGIEISTRRFLVTDSAAFNQVAAHALLRGADPYATSMAGVARLLRVPSHYWTYTVDGGHVSHFSYPAGSFLLNVPGAALGVHLSVDWTDLVAWIVTIALVFILLPAGVRWLAALLGLTPFFLGSFASGGTDALFLPFLVLAVWRWDRYGCSDEPGLARWVGPMSLGVACAMKQSPWFAVPLLVTGVFLEARRGGRAPLRLSVRYVLTVVVTFAALNLPFAAWHPRSWFNGTFLPLTAGLVADGQGLVTLATHGLTGGVNLSMLSLTGALAVVGCVAALVAWYPQLKRIWPLLLTVPFFFAPRSLSTYLVDLVPVALVAAVSVRGAPQDVTQDRVAPRRDPLARLGLLMVAVSSLGVVITSFLAFTGPPLQLSVRGVVTSHGGTELNAVRVSVLNTTPQRLTPHFLVDTATSRRVEGFWTPAQRGAAVLGPHDSETITLLPPGRTAAPQRGAHWLVEAYTLDPAWLSTSSLVTFRRS